MSRRASTRSRVSSSASSYSIDLREAIARFFPHSGLALVVKDDKLHWVPRMLVICAILMTLDLADLLTDSFDRARGVLVRMYPSRRRPGGSYAGFMGMLARHSAKYLALLLPALLLADAGFTGYDFLKKVMDGGRSFLIRVGSNVQLLLKLGWCCEEHEGIVYLWPHKTQKRKQPPLVLRLITVVDGRNRRIDLLSSVLDRKLLPDATALALYRRRWGVELIYRSLKQTMGKRKLRCGAPANAAVELQWAVMGLWLLGLMTVSRIVEKGGAPGSWSVACSLRVVRQVMDGVLRSGLH